MIRAAAKLFLLLVFALPAAAAPKFATVRIGDIYRHLQSTIDFHKGIESERAAIIKDDRAVYLQKVVEELKAIQTQLQARREAPVDDAMRKLARDYEIKRQEGQTLQEEFETFKAQRQKEINARMVPAMRVSLNKISDTTRRIAKEQGFDGVFDSSGLSNTALPVLLYVKNAKDITPDVVAALKDAGDPSVSDPPPGSPDPTLAPAPSPAAPEPPKP